MGPSSAESAKNHEIPFIETRDTRSIRRPLDARYTEKRLGNGAADHEDIREGHRREKLAQCPNRKVAPEDVPLDPAIVKTLQFVRIESSRDDDDFRTFVFEERSRRSSFSIGALEDPST